MGLQRIAPQTLAWDLWDSSGNRSNHSGPLTASPPQDVFFRAFQILKVNYFWSSDLSSRSYSQLGWDQAACCRGQADHQELLSLYSSQVLHLIVSQ